MTLSFQNVGKGMKLIADSLKGGKFEKAELEAIKEYCDHLSRATQKILDRITPPPTTEQSEEQHHEQAEGGVDGGKSK